MKPTAVLVNAARGPVVDQRALYDALKERRIAAAGLDVAEVEPIPLGRPAAHAGQRRHHAARRQRQRRDAGEDGGDGGARASCRRFAARCRRTASIRKRFRGESSAEGLRIAPHFCYY